MINRGQVLTNPYTLSQRVHIVAIEEKHMDTPNKSRSRRRISDSSLDSLMILESNLTLVVTTPPPLPLTEDPEKIVAKDVEEERNNKQHTAQDRNQSSHIRKQLQQGK